MPLGYDHIMRLPSIVCEQEVSAKDTILNALGVGATELPFVYERGLVALPMMAAVVAHPGFCEQDPRYGLTCQQILHGNGQRQTPLRHQGQTMVSEPARLAPQSGRHDELAREAEYAAIGHEHYVQTISLRHGYPGPPVR